MTEQIQNHLSPGHPWRNSILWFDSVDSTNTLAKELAADGAPAGTVLIADMQTGGRGRMGRHFHSPAGTGIYLSLILRPDCMPDELMHLTCACAVYARNAIARTTGLQCGIKWINDLIANGKKLAGILTELSLSSDGRIRYAIVGIGINCSQKEYEFPSEIASIATSLSIETNKAVDRSRMIAALIESFYEMDENLLSEKAQIMEQYRQNCITLGKHISIHRDKDPFYGVALQIDDNGALIVEHPNGKREAITSGEASIRGMYGYI